MERWVCGRLESWLKNEPNIAYNFIHVVEKCVLTSRKYSLYIQINIKRNK